MMRTKDGAKKDGAKKDGAGMTEYLRKDERVTENSEQEHRRRNVWWRRKLRHHWWLLTKPQYRWLHRHHRGTKL
jgi:hypothetical protein